MTVDGSGARAAALVAAADGDLLSMPEYFDAFGLDPAWHDRWMKFCGLYRRWLRLEVQGLENIPPRGPAILVGNHAGGRLLEAGMLQYSARRLHPAKRIVRPLVHWQMFKFMLAGHVIGQYAGGVVEHPRNADHLLERGELVLVYPEGSWSNVKTFAQRDQLCAPQHWGTSFVRTALRNRVPVIPVAAQGFESAVPTLWQSRRLARLWRMRMGTLPVSPQSFLTFGHPQASGLFPLPVRCRLSIGRPIDLRQVLPGGRIGREDELRELALLVRSAVATQLADLAPPKDGAKRMGVGGPQV